MALAVPPKLRELDVGVMAADQINQKTCAALIDLHKDSKNLAVQGRIQHDNSNVVDMQIRQTEVFVINEYFINSFLFFASFKLNIFFSN